MSKYVAMLFKMGKPSSEGLLVWIDPDGRVGDGPRYYANADEHPPYFGEVWADIKESVESDPKWEFVIVFSAADMSDGTVGDYEES